MARKLEPRKKIVGNVYKVASKAVFLASRSGACAQSTFGAEQRFKRAGLDCFLGDPKNSHPGPLEQLSPSDPLLVHTKGGTAWRHFRIGRCDDASSRAKRALLENLHYKPALRATAAIKACLGMRHEAREVIARTGQVVCAFRIGDAGTSGRTTWKSSKTAFERTGLPE
jgi:hypothetical protein